jgi:carboxy-terminal domain RNA polymerase II polypeptide A small phosphatase
MLLILDIDETVVYATTARLDRPPDFEVAGYFVYRRPGLDEFLKSVSQHFQLAVWSSSGSDYAKQIVEKIFPDLGSLRFVWTRERCTRCLDPETREAYHVKDLKKVKKLGYRIEEILVVDDSPEKVERNYGNHVGVRPYEGQPDDNELGLLMRYLDRLKNVPNVRTVEKRNWRSLVREQSNPET